MDRVSYRIPGHGVIFTSPHLKVESVDMVGRFVTDSYNETALVLRCDGDDILQFAAAVGEFCKANPHLSGEYAAMAVATFGIERVTDDEQ